MTHRRYARPLALGALALLLASCGGQAPVQLDVAPAAANDEPVAEAPVTSKARVTPGRPDRSDQPEVTEAEPVAPVAEVSEPPAPASPAPADPELVVDEDGCATDVATGIVVACHDPAAGPDDD